jgi:RNA polymerase sigma-70 factor, ECF subfamily
VSEEDAGAGAELLSRALAGEAAAFRTLVLRYQRSVYSLAVRMLADRHLAEDLAQEVFLQLHRSLRSIESEAHLAFWLRRVTLHRALDRLRRSRIGQAVPLEEAAELIDERGEVDPLLQRRLRALLAELPPAQRAVMLLRYQEDLDPMDIARTLKMPTNTVKSHLKRALTLLRERLQPTGAHAESASTPGRPSPGTESSS